MNAKEALQVYKAFSVIGDDSCGLENNHFFTVLDGARDLLFRTKDGYEIYSQDGEQIYPLLAYLGKSGKIPLTSDTTGMFYGIVWKYFNQKAEAPNLDEQVLEIAAMDSPTLMVQLRDEAEEFFKAYQEMDLYVSFKTNSPS